MKMMKTILSLWLVSSALMAQDVTVEEKFEDEGQNERSKLTGKGFFIGVDYEQVEATTRYKVDSQNQLSNIPNYTDKFNEPAYKLGYQYYFTRLYFKYSTLEEETIDYTVDSTSYELNAEYIPIFYRGDSFAIRGIFGTSLGYIDSEVKDLSARLEQEAQFVGLTDFSDKEAIYGIQVGLMLEMSFGLSAELGYRYRRANVLESENSDGTVTFETKRKQLYMGLNYIF